MSNSRVVVFIVAVLAFVVVGCMALAAGLVVVTMQAGVMELASSPQEALSPPTAAPGLLPATPQFRVTVVPVPLQPTRELPSPTSLPTRASPAETPTPFPSVAPLTLSAEEQVLNQVYERVNPSVVNIEVRQNVPQGPGSFDFSVSGSGFVIDREGHIVTNSHVVAHAAQVWVTLYDDTRVPAEVMGADPDSDLAVLKVSLPPDRLTPVELGDSSQVRVGQRAIAIGNPFGLEGSMTLGIVSAVGRTIPSGLSLFSIPEVIQTDAPINPGNSGGPLLDLAGRVIGVNTQIRSEDRANSGVGFAVPVNTVKRVVPELVATGRYTWPWLGVRGTTLTPDIAEANRLAVQRGAYIVEVMADGPSAKSGLRGATGEREIAGRPVPIGGDVVIAADDAPIRNFDELLVYVTQGAVVGQTVELTVIRDGQEVKVQVTLEPRPSSTSP